VRKVGFDNLNILDIHIHPNPSNGIVEVNLSRIPNVDKTVQLINMAGQVVYQQKLTALQDMVSVDVSGITPGIYFINISADQRFIEAKKIIITN